jgi:hypothetical protein
MGKFENIDQQLKKELFEDILAQVNRPTFWDLSTKGWPNYLLNSKIAAYSLYNSTYLVTDKMKLILEQHGIDFNEYHTRSKISNIREGRKKITTYEHMVPCVVQRDLIKEIYLKNGKVTREELTEILSQCSSVVIMTQYENSRLERRYKSSMPSSCDPMVNPEERYTICGIVLTDTVVKMKGQMIR